MAYRMFSKSEKKSLTSLRFISRQLKFIFIDSNMQCFHHLRELFIEVLGLVFNRKIITTAFCCCIMISLLLLSTWRAVFLSIIAIYGYTLLTGFTAFKSILVLDYTIAIMYLFIAICIIVWVCANDVYEFIYNVTKDIDNV